MTRRLAAILAADVVGFTSHLRADRPGALEALRLHRRELVEPLLASHRGRIVEISGGAATVEFASLLEALRCAVTIQRGMEPRNAGVSSRSPHPVPNRNSLRRAGARWRRVDGEGVAIAARLQAQATPGGIVVSATVRGQVGDKEGLRFADLGERMAEIGGRPLHSFAIKLVAAAPDRVPPAPPAGRRSPCCRSRT